MKPLRRRHLQIWTVWAIFIPIGMIAAYVNIPKKVAGELIQIDSGKALPLVINSIDKTNYSVALRSSEDKSQLQLEWINKNASAYPSSLIYKVSNEKQELKDAELIGRVEAKDHFYFPLKNDSTAKNIFVLYDIIHQQKIDIIKLTP